MKILVTGAAGFLGPAVVDRLLAHGYTDIRCNVRQRANIPKLEGLSRRYPHAVLEFLVGNLRYRKDAARAMDGVQLVIHLAARLKGSAADLFQDSVVASRNLLDAVVAQRQLRVVLVSSFGVYGAAGLERGAIVNENTALEIHPEWRDHYSHAKLRQEQLFWDYQKRYGFELVVLRPGVIYGPGGSHFSNRVGLRIGDWQLHFGGNNLLPLSYVDNCAEAVIVAGTHPEAAGEVYNVHDSDLPTSRQYLGAYKKHVKEVHSISVPYFAVQLFSSLIAKYHRYSKGQLPAILTPYKSACVWGGHRFDNSKLRSIGWKQLVPTSEGLRRSFAAFRNELDAPASKESTSSNPIVGAEQVPPGEFQNRPGEFVVGAVLGAESNGGFDHLLSAFSNLCLKGKKARLLVFGGNPSGHIGNSADARDLHSRIDWVSDGPDAGNLLQECDVLVSLQTGVPKLVLQAMSSDIPVITTAIRAPAVLQHQRTAMVIPHDNGPELQETLEELADDAELRLILGGHARKKMESRYSSGYLHRDFAQQGATEQSTRVRSLVKGALYSVVPNPHIIRHGNRSRPEIALTIDDGPDPVFTPRILEICNRYNWKATFFVVGGCAEQYPELVLQMDREGHEIGNHSYSHPYFNQLTWQAASEEIEMTRSVLDSILKKRCMLFRPPSGKLSFRTLVPAWATGHHVAMWSVDLKDYCAQAGDVEAKLARTALAPGDVILYHGTSDAALQALPRVIESAMEQGLRPGTVSELIRP